MAKTKLGASLSDVASAAGVSPSTVSRYLNAGIKLPASTSERIDAAIKTLRYVPNPLARSLGRGRSDTVGLVIPDIANPFFASLASAVEQAAEEHGQGVLLSATSNSAAREVEYVSRMLRNRVSGLLFVSGHHNSSDLAETLAAAPGLILIDEDVPGIDCSKVFCDNENGGRLAGQYLASVGHKRIAFIGGPEKLRSTTERLTGLREAAEENGANVVMTCFGNYSPEFGRQAAAQILQSSEEPTAVFVSSGEIAFGLLEALQAADIAIPERLSLIVFDDAGPLHLFNPALTAIRQPIREMGRKAVELALAESDENAAFVEFLLPVELIVRASVTAPKAT
ncbi:MULTISPECIES: LacI family DNA-binding transcriptional regulator [Burkholderiaceae]|uniref:LacI family DNA-binding transcriptional regulator n=1 Tax=Burkholderiaceae TaxID=119060 RepID=UPI00076AEBEC|nr:MULTISPECIES: LacI family DNA-binding transcriptional regulator [Burkholderiaceae]AMH43450.1 transcriptional regulator [Burkholderia sp. PAMC 26561]